MLRPKTRWRHPVVDRGLARRLAEELDIHPLVAELLVIRGLHDPEQASRFLRPDPAHFHDPFQLLGMEPAVERIRHALQNNEKIRIYGDYDADGVSATVTMIHALRQLDARFDWVIPHRLKEGYGLHPHSIERAREDGVGLIITVDNGISAVEPIALARERGIDVIVTDHHEPPEQLPDAHAIINPKQPGCSYPFKELAGVGVAFKLVHALTGSVPEPLTEFAAIGTIADLMPLVDENRLLVTMGLSRMRRQPCHGMRALLKTAGVPADQVNAGHIAFAAGPRINAAGRLDSADHAVRLLTAADEGEAAQYASRLDQLNKERQEMVDEVYGMALEQAKRRKDDEVIVAAGEGWNVGIVGIVASRLLETFYRPAIVLDIDGESGLAKGSARSIPGFDLHAALTECSDLMEQFGGHQAAAGMTLQSGNIEALRERLCQLARSSLRPEDYIPVTEADIRCDLEDISLELVEQLQALEPFGIGNPSPKFHFPELDIVDMRWLGKDGNHLKLGVAPLPQGRSGSALSGGSGTIRSASPRSRSVVEAIGFQYGHLRTAISATSPVEIVGKLEINEWNGRRKPQIVIQDLQIRVPQVHDWRGRRPEQLKPEEDWPEALSTGLLLCDGVAYPETAAANIPDHWGMWSVSPDGPPQPLNSAAADTPWQQLEGIVLYALPPDVGLLRGALQQAGPGVEHIAAWFAASPFAVPTAASAERVPFPERDGFKRLYAWLKNRGALDERDPAQWIELVRATGFERDTLRWMLAVFEELGFVEKDGDTVALAESPEKRDLAQSPTYRMRMAMEESARTLLHAGAKELAANLRSMLPRTSALDEDMRWEETV